MKEALKVKKNIDKRILKKNLSVVGNKAIIKDTGEVVAGINVIQRSEKFKIDVDM